MRYYKLNHSTSKKEVGEFPQVTSLAEKGNYYADNKDFDIEFYADIPEARLREQAKKTSYIGGMLSTHQHMLVHKDLAKVLMDFEENDYELFNSPLHSKSMVDDNYRLLVIHNFVDEQLINFKDSTWQKRKFVFSPKVEYSFKIKNFEDYLKLKKISFKESGKSIFCDKLVLDINNMNKHFFRLKNTLKAGYYVSEKLREKLIEHNFTGLNFDHIKG